MDAYCEDCSLNRCDCYPDECPVKYPTVADITGLVPEGGRWADETDTRPAAYVLRIIALALTVGDQRDGLGDAIPQEVWDDLHEEGLVETLRDITGDGFTNASREGVKFLLDLIDKEAGRVSG